MNTNQVISVPSEGNTLTEALGITEKRRDELLTHLHGVIQNSSLNKTSDILEESTSISNNQNETAFISFVIGTREADCSSNCPVKRLMKGATKVEVRKAPPGFEEFMRSRLKDGGFSSIEELIKNMLDDLME